MSALDAILAQPTITHDLAQGTDAWDAFRLEHRGASEAAAMLGLSRNMTRPELLAAKHTGIAREFSRFVQERVLDKGHEVEALARPLVEARLGEDLYPVTCSRGPLSASCDGLTLSDDDAFEHKQWNEDLAAMVAAGIVPDEHIPQCQQILLVTGAKRVHFTVSDGTPERMVVAVVTPDRAWWERIAAGWAQFDKDLAGFTPRAAEPPKPTGRAPETLPALRIEITGAVTASNLAEFKATALGAIQSVNRSLTTDEHFADAEQAVKWCGEIESRIKGAKEHALSQTATIDTLFRTLDDVSTEARRVRLDLEKLVERRKTEIKGELVAEARRAYEQHEAAVRQEAGAWKPLQQPDFAAAIKGKRSVDAMRAALDATLANAKIAADDAGRGIRAALAALDEASQGFSHLFADRLSFIGKAPEDVRMLARARISDHQVTEQRRAEAEAEKAREKIRAEEAAKLRQQQEAEATAQRQRDEEAARVERERLAALTHPNGAPMFSKTVIKENGDPMMLDADGKRSVFCDLDEGDDRPASTTAAPAPATVHQLPARTAAPAVPAGPPTLSIGALNERIAPLRTDAAGLITLGFPPTQVGGGKYLHEHDYGHILAAMVQHLEALQAKQAA